MISGNVYALLKMPLDSEMTGMGGSCWTPSLVLVDGVFRPGGRHSDLRFTIGWSEIIQTVSIPTLDRSILWYGLSSWIKSGLFLVCSGW
jgi:hypothetical protein